MNKPLYYCLGVAALGFVACGGHETTAQAPASETAPVDVTVAPVRTASRVERIEVSGTVRAAETANIAARIMGQIRTVAVREGSRVSAGATLAEIDDRELRSAVAAAQAGRASAQSSIRTAEHGIASAVAQRELAQATYERYSTLFGKQSLTKQELDEATARLRQAEAAAEAAQSRKAEAEAQLTAAEARVESAEVALGHARVTAPFAGTVTEQLLDPGSLTAPGQPILRLEKAGRYRLEAAIPESQSDSVRIGSTVTVELEGIGPEKGLEGRVVEIVPEVDAASRTFIAKIELPARAGVRSGLYGRAFLAGPEREAAVVPAAAVAEQGQLRTVLVADGDVARKRLVKVGELREGEYEILSGVKAGELVVVSGGVADGARVNARQAGGNR